MAAEGSDFLPLFSEGLACQVPEWRPKGPVWSHVHPSTITVNRRMDCVDWPGLGHRARGPGWIHLTGLGGRGGSSREVQTLIREAGSRAAGPCSSVPGIPKSPSAFVLRPCVPISLFSALLISPSSFSFIPPGLGPCRPLHSCCNPACPLPPGLLCPFCGFPWHRLCQIPHPPPTWLGVMVACGRISLPHHWEGSGPPLLATGKRQKGTVDYRAPTVDARAGHSRFLIAFNFSTIL